MPPVAAVSLVFALVLGAALWIYIVRLSFQASTLMGIVALIIPPIPLAVLLANPAYRQSLVLPTALLILFTSIAAFYHGPSPFRAPAQENTSTPSSVKAPVARNATT